MTSRFSRFCLGITFLVLGTPATALEGTLISIGSDTMAGIMTQWGQSFTELYPDVSIEIQATGSASAPPALERGAANIGSMSRMMSKAEYARFTATNGYPPTAIAVASDSIAVIVHPSNPVESLSLREIDGIYSQNHYCGSEIISSWAQVQQAAGWSSATIQAAARTTVSGTQSYFSDVTLCGGDLKPTVYRMMGAAAIVDFVSETPSAIGYVGEGFVDHSVKAIKIENRRDGFETEAESALQRELYLYFNFDPRKPIPELECQFLQFVFSRVGQAQLEAYGFAQLDREIRVATLQTLALSGCQ